MPGRTIAVGDIHGDMRHLAALMRILPRLTRADTIVFVGDYLDRGPDSAKVVEYLRVRLPRRTKAKVVALRGSHEDAWIKVRREGYPQFVVPAVNGCFQTLRSFRGAPAPGPNELATADEFRAMLAGSFFPDEVIEWMESLPTWYEDDHAIYVHAGLPPDGNGGWLHPSRVEDPRPLMWQRLPEFYRDYEGKRVVFGHTIVEKLPQELSLYTPKDRTDMYFTEHLVGLDTNCGNGGWLTAIDLPILGVYESRSVIA